MRLVEVQVAGGHIFKFPSYILNESMFLQANFQLSTVSKIHLPEFTYEEFQNLFDVVLPVPSEMYVALSEDGHVAAVLNCLISCALLEKTKPKDAWISALTTASRLKMAYTHKACIRSLSERCVLTSVEKVAIGQVYATHSPFLRGCRECVLGDDLSTEEAAAMGWQNAFLIGRTRINLVIGPRPPPSDPRYRRIKDIIPENYLEEMFAEPLREIDAENKKFPSPVTNEKGNGNAGLKRYDSWHGFTGDMDLSLLGPPR
ncbi:unnamed protein product [Cyclocybe aegerita]|uniref:Uncharacterized protein n=1 Tax=Cyclocybe aegerita TaxID=1973307 RepID=A0A8S0VQL7_CYCAE|nr:unnamed protein product [Cyclocybe aegerita]